MWAPSHLTMKEALEILHKQQEEAGIRPGNRYQTLDEEIADRNKKIEAWKKAHPGEPWGLEKVMQEDLKRKEQLEAKNPKA